MSIFDILSNLMTLEYSPPKKTLLIRTGVLVNELTTTLLVQMKKKCRLRDVEDGNGNPQTYSAQITRPSLRGGGAGNSQSG